MSPDARRLSTLLEFVALEPADRVLVLRPNAPDPADRVGTLDAALVAEPAAAFTAAQLFELVEAGPGMEITLGDKVRFTSTVRAAPAPPAPSAPTIPQVDDRANTFSGVAVSGWPSYVEYVYFTPDSGGVKPLISPAGYNAGNRIVLSGLTGDYEPGTVGIAVAASGNRPQGRFLLNDKPFTSKLGAVLPAGTVTGTGSIGSDSLVITSAISS